MLILCLFRVILGDFGFIFSPFSVIWSIYGDYMYILSDLGLF